MATVFMKWLETSPEKYDQGIAMLTLGRVHELKELIVQNFVEPGTRVLEIGCGTGTLSAMMAAKGAHVTAIDSSPRMLAAAQKRLADFQNAGKVVLKYMDATQIGDKFAQKSFDLIVSTLVFSEIAPNEQRYVLEACKTLLAPEGRLLLADETIPSGLFRRLIYHLVRAPLALLTWLLTRATTQALRAPQTLLIDAGFAPQVRAVFLGGSLKLFEAKLLREQADEFALTQIPRLTHQVTLRTIFLDAWGLFFRIIPPYPKYRSGLYRLGTPQRDAPVLVTGNYDLTVRRLVKALDGNVNAWLLIADSAGINVWCGAGGGYFTAEKVIAALKASRLETLADQRALILPQLCANGVDGWRIRQETGWGVHWGPVRAADIPAYLQANRKKSDRMRWVRFPLKDRLEMVTVTLGFYALLILLPLWIFWRPLFWPVTASLLGLSYFYAIVHPWLPGRDGLQKSVALASFALLGLWVYSGTIHPFPAARLFNWSIGLTGLAVFTAAELQGMSPLMRGEQANWGWEAIIAAALGLIYWIIPMVLGWR